MKSAVKELEEKGKAAKAASKKLAFLSTEVKNKALLNIADALIDKLNEILIANKIDYEKAKASGIVKPCSTGLCFLHLAWMA